MKKFFIALMGGTVLLVGTALLVLPGPGVPIIAAGLAILATEFIWAKRAMRKGRYLVKTARRKPFFSRMLFRRGVPNPSETRSSKTG